MGLDTFATGLSREETYHGGYSIYGSFIEELISHAYDEKCREIYHRTYFDGFYKATYIGPVTKDEIEYWNAHCNDDLDILIFHSDCDGKFSPVECRKIYNAIKDIQFHLDENSIYSQYMLEILSIFKKMFHHCARRRVNLYYR